MSEEKQPLSGVGFDVKERFGDKDVHEIIHGVWYRIHKVKRWMRRLPDNTLQHSDDRVNWEDCLLEKLETVKEKK